MDIEQTTADGRPNGDWTLEDGMVVPVHLLYPGGEHERFRGGGGDRPERRPAVVLVGIRGVGRWLERPAAILRIEVHGADAIGLDKKERRHRSFAALKVSIAVESASLVDAQISCQFPQHIVGKDE
jgi:hypothetical protein